MRCALVILSALALNLASLTAAPCATTRGDHADMAHGEAAEMAATAAGSHAHTGHAAASSSSHGDVVDDPCADGLCGTVFCADCAICVAAPASISGVTTSPPSSDRNAPSPVDGLSASRPAADPPPPRTA